MKRMVRALWLFLASVAIAGNLDAQETATSVILAATPSPAPFFMRLGFGGAVNVMSTPNWPSASAPKPVLACASAPAFAIVSNGSVNGVPYCVTATTAGINVVFQTEVPYVTPAVLTCGDLGRTNLDRSGELVAVEVRLGRTVQHPYFREYYDGGRAQCDVDRDYAYALLVESPGARAVASGTNAVRTLTIPWSLLHPNRRTDRLMINVSLCASGHSCQHSDQIVAVLAVSEGSASIGLAEAPYVRLHTPEPAPGTAPLRNSQLEFDGGYNWDDRDLLQMTLAQNQSYVTGQRALSQALSLAPVSLPTAPSFTITQTLQAQSQSLFAFQAPSDMLEDQSLRPLFDVVPLSISRVSSLASGYAYGYSSSAIKGAMFYGNQGPGSYGGGTALTLAVTTPTPSPNPTPPLPKNYVPSGAAVILPLRAPPPPAPLFESATASVPPAELSLVSGFTGSKGKRDGIDALAFELHAFHDESANDTYDARTLNLFGRFESDAQAPALASGTSRSRFLGESATLTQAKTESQTSYLQMTETVAEQQDDAFFAPTSGTLTWLTPLDGPVAHVSVSYANGKKARFFALDLFGFRLSDPYGDAASQLGWQASVPLPDFFAQPGWLLSIGSETQTVSDRMAALEQGVVANYASAVAEVAQPETRPQRLGNATLLSPTLGKTLHVQFVGGDDFGTATGCANVAPPSAKTPSYQCAIGTTDRRVGGAFFTLGKLGFGATNTATLEGNISAGAAARNLGTSGSLPGSTTAYLTFKSCPVISAAFTNAAFPASVPLPQQGATLSSEIEQPIQIGGRQIAVGLGYYNERATANPSSSGSGFFGVLRWATPFDAVEHPQCR